MIKFIKNLLLFIFPIIISAYFIDIFISANLKKSNSFAQKEYPVWNALLTGKINADIVIYGSSKAWVQIDPSMISDSLHLPAYNLGMDGHNFSMQYLRHLVLLKNNTKPQLIIHSLDIATLDKRKELYNAEQFLPYMLWNKEIKNTTQSYLGFSSYDYEVPLIRYYSNPGALGTAIKLFLNPGDNKIEKVNGFQARDISWTGDFDKAKERMAFYETKLDTPTIYLFEKYLNECKAQNIKIIFVYCPEYIDGQKFMKNRDQIIKLFTKLSVKYNIPFYDYSSDFMSFDKKYFYNASHLNKLSAQIFTNKLIAQLKKTDLLNGVYKNNK